MIRSYRCFTSIVISLAFANVLAAQDFVVPISANSPHVFMSLTEERDADDTSFFSIPSDRPNAPGYPENQEPHYEVAIFDTGAPATIISHAAFENFDLRGAGKEGINPTELGGVGPSIAAINSDPLGVYAVGFDGLLTDPRTGRQVVDTSQLKGTINDSILYGPSGSALPNLIGTTTSSHYTTIINYSDPRILDYNDETYRSPAMSMTTLGFVEEPSRRIQLTLVPGALGTPAFLPDLANFDFDDLSNNPSTPTIAGTFWLTANVNNNGATRNRLEAIFDTGAQGSFVSEQIAAEMGFDVENDKPDFVVRIAGVTGVSEEVPGFYADEFILPGTDGGLVLKDVPLIVFDLTDPRDGLNTLDALIGMNLFSSRDLVLNPEPGNSYLGVSDPSQPYHGWTSQAPTAAWSTPNSWAEPGIPDVDWYADVFNQTGTPQVANISADSSIGMLVTTGHESNPDGTMTLSIQDGATLTIFGNAIIREGSNVQLDNAALDTLAVEIRGGSVSGTGDVRGEVLSQGFLVPGNEGGIGTLSFPGSLDQLSDGVLRIDLGDNSDRSNLQHDRLAIEGAMGIDGRVEFTTTDDYTQPEPGESDRFTIILAEGRVSGEFSGYSFNGIELEREFPQASDLRAFRDHTEDGQFISVSYLNLNSFSLRNYQAIEGDVNGDGEVQFDDFVVLSGNFNQEGTWTEGDFDGNGLVDFPDFLALSENFGTIARAQSVPEPATGTLALFGFVFALLRRRRKSH